MKANALLRRFGLAAPVALALLLCACAKQELYSNLSERQANEMIAVLKTAGIDSDKDVKEGQFSISTSSSDFPNAIRTLSAQGYPRETFDNMGQVFKREGFVSSPLEERARLLHAMSQEIANTLTNIDGVVTARVHLQIPEKNPLSDKPQPASAAVFIKYRADKNLSSQITQIKALVVNSVEGLAYDNVTVALFPAETMPAEAPKQQAAATPVAQISRGGTPLLAGAAFGVLALGGGGLLWLRRRGTAHEEAPAPRVAAGSAPGKSRDLVAAEMQNALRRAAGRK
ncbi:MAG TPA: type III secretion inner membrane ring lipoprotein SctJ [Burkholderiaceae bacterium]|nr:type III secretion inner membrane ring lipoprotein SctJ [Burkholderiaceae bacterium]